ncbi:MAG: hypothetical protein ACK4K3_07515 [Aquabacterium sp.]
MSSDRQAVAIRFGTKKGTKTLREYSSYPVFPAAYPNRKIRRLYARDRVDLMPTEWRVFITTGRVH